MKCPLIHIFLLTGVLVFFERPAFGQDTAYSIKNDTLSSTEIVEPYLGEPPSYPGGVDAYKEFLKKHIKYPKKALAAKASGHVYVSMVINKNGTISHVHVEKDNVGYGCGEEAVRVIRNMPRWKPGKDYKGHIRKVRYVVPVKFALP